MGNYDPQLNSMLCVSTHEQLARFNITKAFVSAFGLDDKTATTNHEQQAEILRRVLDAADRRYLIIDQCGGYFRKRCITGTAFVMTVRWSKSQCISSSASS